MLSAWTACFFVLLQTMLHTTDEAAIPTVSCLHHSQASSPFCSLQSSGENSNSWGIKSFSLSGANLCLLILHFPHPILCCNSTNSPFVVLQISRQLKPLCLLSVLSLPRKPHPSLITPAPNCSASHLPRHPYSAGAKSKIPFRVHLLQGMFSNSTILFWCPSSVPFLIWTHTSLYYDHLSIALTMPQTLASTYQLLFKLNRTKHKLGT